MNVAPVSSSAHLLATLPPEPSLSGRGPNQPADHEKVAAQFEAILVRQLLAPALNGVMGGGGQGGGAGAGMYSYMLTDILSSKLTEGQGLGLGAVLARQLAPRGSVASAPEES
jgi:flagellar protein FlgJ